MGLILKLWLGQVDPICRENVKRAYLVACQEGFELLEGNSEASNFL